MEKAKPRRHFRFKKIEACLSFTLIGILIISFVQGSAVLAADPSQASLVQIIDTSQFSPPSPDPAGIVFIDFYNTLIVSDSEVNELPIFSGDNLFEMTPDGYLVDTLTTTSFSSEPTGVAFNPFNRHLFISDDNLKEIFEIDPGPDGLYDTPDDIVRSFDTLVFNSTDPEGITFDTWEEVLFVIDGIGAEVYRVDPGADGIFNGVPPIGDDEVTSFDTLVLGVRDPEGIAFNTDNGNLFIVGEPTNRVAEVTTDGNLVRMIDITAAPVRQPAGLAYAPSSINPSERNLFIADRGVDNNSDPNENDGVIFEVHIPGLVPDTTAPVWDGLTTGIGLAQDAGTGGAVKVEFDTASDDVEGAGVKFNIYYAETALWDSVNWSNNAVILDVAPAVGSTYANSYTVSGLTNGVTYTFGVRVEDRLGNEDSNTTSASAIPSGSGGPTELIFAAVADTYVNSNQPSANYGTDTNLRLDASPEEISFLRFNVSGLSGPVVSARIQLECINASPEGGTIYAISDNSWQETAVTYNNYPDIDGAVLDALGEANIGDVVELDVTAAINGNGSYSFAMDSTRDNGVHYYSREGARPPVLIINTSSGSDTTAPAAPVDLSAIAGDSQVVLSWADNGESDLAGYNVYRSEAPGVSPASGAQLNGAVLANSAFVDTTTINGTTYYYIVTAEDTTGNESTASTEASATPSGGDTTAPAAPAGLTATAGDSQVVLNWADNSESDLAGYNVYRSTAPGVTPVTGTQLNDAVLANSAFVDTTAINGTTYYYVVTAEDTIGNESTASTETSAIPNGTIDTNAPVWDGLTTGIGLAEDTGTGGAVMVEFDAASDDVDGTAVKFNIYYSETTLWDNVNWTNNAVILDVRPAVGSIYANAYTITGLMNGVSYTFGVRVEDQSGNEDSNTTSASVIPTGSGGEIELAFAAVADTYVNRNRPSLNYGNDTDIRLDSDPEEIGYFRFNVSGLSGAVVSARIQLECINASPEGGTIYTISDNSWQENAVTYNHRPAVDGVALDALGEVNIGDVVELDVTAAINGNGTYSFAMDSTRPNGVHYYSREGANPPKLIIITSN